MYKKLQKGLSGIEFVETFYGLDFEKFLEEESTTLKDDHALDLNFFLEPSDEVDPYESKNINIFLA